MNHVELLLLAEQTRADVGEQHTGGYADVSVDDSTKAWIASGGDTGVERWPEAEEKNSTDHGEQIRMIDGFFSLFSFNAR